MPNLYMPSYARSEKTARRREFDCSDRSSEREVVYSDSAGKVGEDSATVFVYREEEIALGVEGESSDVLAVGEW